MSKKDGFFIIDFRFLTLSAELFNRKIFRLGGGVRGATEVLGWSIGGGGGGGGDGVGT